MTARQIALDTQPRRLQRRRLKGWRAPDGAVYVGRGSRWGNPFTVADCLEANWADTADEARKINVEFFESWLDGTLDGGPGPEGTSWSQERRDWIREHVAELKGRDLMCWCPLPAPGETDHCHGAVLLRLANSSA
ncbi:DUF4326 domain-containing protein [Streptomyces spinosisporus]|jgi:hypothetical protein|uniref:DUF4326 domain-containing protein n=1 Tax=Streptomyces spinosisporus TaxID=2927582 RepID=A0ABS9XWL9_9ACTN|nr:DUF4326 domain-containing protein [Streptomyces spinosisporus]MCI3246480.1 DUF4326 domain-containing protein [Streptomyces spinosisporus]